MGLTDALLQKLGNEAKDFRRWRTGVEVEITDYNMPDRWRKMQDKTFFGAYSVTTGKRARTIRGAKVAFSLIEALAENDDAEPMELMLGSYATDREQAKAKYSIWFKPDGTTIQETHWVRGGGEGIYLRDDGSIRRRMQYANGFAEGKCINYDENGVTTAVEWFHDGQPIGAPAAHADRTD